MQKKKNKSKKKNKKEHSSSTLFIILLVITIVLLILVYIQYKSTKEEKTYKETVTEIIADIKNAESPEDFFQHQIEEYYSKGAPYKHYEQENDENSARKKSSASSEYLKKASGMQNDSIKTSSIEIPLCRGTHPDTKDGEHSDHEVHEYLGFTLCYRESYENPEWVAYTLTSEELNAVTGRTEDFRQDPNISTGSATLSDYRGSGYDRGHMAPAADMEWSKESASESFLLSNMSPQAPQLNRGLWKDLESQVRTWAKTFGEVTVVTGPVLEKNAEEYTYIGQNKVSVPEYYYKVLLAQKDKKKIAAAFILPNKKCEGTIWDYSVSIDEVEERTSLDFFSMLQDEEENILEENILVDDWK